MEVPSSPSNGNGDRQRPDATYVMMAAATMFKNGNLTEEQKQARQEVGPEYTETLKAMGDIGGLGQGFTAEGKTRSENVEDVRQTGQIGQADRAADVSLGRIKGQGVGYELTKMTAGRTKIAPSVMAKQLGYEDIDRAADAAAANRAKQIMAVRRR